MPINDFKEGTDIKDLFQNWSLLISTAFVIAYLPSSYTHYDYVNYDAEFHQGIKIKMLSTVFFLCQEVMLFHGWRKSNTDLIAHCFAGLYTVLKKKFDLRKLIQNVNLIKVIKFKMYHLIKIINSKCKFNKDNEFKM